ncbi:hypothetical protein QIT80_gp51 (endogenous virus) [Pseudomonas phage phiAH14a]|uniref:Uncharacterized protein n=1 Tax=Pseudomonas phage phiAH14a TaxID=1805958 RepID=A0A1B0VP53_9CAUD|nr:hypothetical protein QIT80_gp51 [Pseudomonas phage phiAH14a]AMW64511.1 hypothetical protein AH14a_p51 [Pseudomonas phage phiAH14a]
MSHDNGHGKPCPDCGEPMTNLPSLNMRQCATGCKEKFDWKLAEGQTPLLTDSRDRGMQA